MADGADKPTILIVDDVPDNITVLSNILSGYNLKAANNGAKALEIASHFKPDIILLDIMMPEMDGYTVCKRLKRNLHIKHIPVIFVTAMDDVTDEARGFELGAVDYIVSADFLFCRLQRIYEIPSSSILQRFELNYLTLTILVNRGLRMIEKKTLKPSAKNG